MKILYIGFICLLSSCGHLQEKPKEVSIPVQQPCLSKRPIQPDMKFDLLPPAKTDAESAEHAKILWLDRQALLLHSSDWNTAAAGCKVLDTKN